MSVIVDAASPERSDEGPESCAGPVETDLSLMNDVCCPAFSEYVLIIRLGAACRDFVADPAAGEVTSWDMRPLLDSSCVVVDPKPE